jgi:site-specific DNA-methyltransferase (adenine-specific)
MVVHPYWQEDGMTIYHGRCEEILPTLPQVDLILTSPPYNLGVTTGGGFPLGHYHADAPMHKRSGMGKWPNAAIANGYGIHEDTMVPEEYERWQQEILTTLWSKLSAQGAIYYNHKPRVQGHELWTPLALNPSLPIRQIIIWARAGGINFSPSFYVPTHEWIIIFAKPAFRLKSKGASGVGDVWYIPQELSTTHPAPFPLKLALTAISTTSAPIVLDPFMGSGTTLLAAKELGRSAMGIDVEESYCEIAVNRLRQAVLPLEQSPISQIGMILD